MYVPSIEVNVAENFTKLSNRTCFEVDFTDGKVREIEFAIASLQFWRNYFLVLSRKSNAIVFVKTVKTYFSVSLDSIF